MGLGAEAGSVSGMALMLIEAGPSAARSADEEAALNDRGSSRRGDGACFGANNGGFLRAWPRGGYDAYKTHADGPALRQREIARL